MTPRPLVLDAFYAGLWAFLLAAMLMLETWAIAKGIPGDTLSDLVDVLRLHLVGRFVVLGFLTWLVYHWGVAPRLAVDGLTWRDLLALAIGFAWALLETLRLRS